MHLKFKHFTCGEKKPKIIDFDHKATENILSILKPNIIDSVKYV